MQHSSFPKAYLYISIFIFLLKVIAVLNINPKYGLDIGNGQGFLLKGILNGSDGENYLTGFLSLKSEGIFSNNSILSYFPAGYPILMFVLSIFGTAWSLAILSILQSGLFSFSIYYFAKQLYRTSLQKTTFLIFIFVLLNPTLTLSSLVIGYESLVASGHILILSIIIKDLKNKESSKSNSLIPLTVVSLICSIISFLQPRVVLGILMVIFFWVFISFKNKIIYFISFALLISSIFPGALIYRNYKAANLVAISTNLGTTMNLGAGDSTTGGYWDEKKGVPCNLEGDAKGQDFKLVNCVLHWYTNNPTKTLSLFLHKSIYFWSPWIGPLAEGTSGRNPWLRYGPLAIISNEKLTAQIIQGSVGIFISALWQVLSIFFLFYGLFRIYKLKNLERSIGITSAIILLVNWAICLVTIGDNRFRLPILGVSIFLQVVGIHILLREKLLGSKK